MENSIEEAIKVMEHWIEYEKNNKEKINRADELINIQETILSAYKRVLKEKNRLEEQVEYDKTHIYTPQTIELNFISKSKIEDKIEKLNSESYAEKLEDMMNTKNYTITELVQYVLQELLDGSDTDVGSIGNSIEEDMKYIHKTLNNMKIKDEDEFMSAVATIFRDYKRVLKENEILKEEKEQAWEEWNSLEQGSYETELKLKEENRELKAEMKDGVIAIKLYALQTENEKLKNKLLDTLEGQKVIKEETPQYIKENFIPVEKVKNKIEHYQKLQYNYIEKYDEINEGLQAMISALQELLESEE